MKILAQKNKDKVIDLLTERLSFERAGVKLYDRVLDRMRQSISQRRGRRASGDYSTYGVSGHDDDASRGIREDLRGEEAAREQDRDRDREAQVVAEMLPHMEEIRDQEKAHEEWLEACIRQLGGDDRHMTEMAILSEREATGIEKVIRKDPELPHLLHALLAAEHVDTAGWDLLAALADEAGDLPAQEDFRKRLQEEERHLAFLRDALRAFWAHELVGKELSAPAGAPSIP